MDPNKRIPPGSIRIHSVLKLKNPGDFAKLKPDFEIVFAASHKYEYYTTRLIFLPATC